MPFSMKWIVLGISILFCQQSAFAVGAHSCQTQSKSMCVPLNTQQQIAADMCRVEMKEAKCDEFYKSHPDLDKDKQRDCDLVASCSSSEKLADYTKACLENWAGAWGDMLTGIYHILAGDIKVSADTKEREKFFAECTSAECKRKMLGPYSELFSKEEIEGHANDKGLDPKDPANQPYLQGLSAKVLYKKLLERISQKMKEGKLDQPVLEPWSGKAAKPLQSVNEMIENALSKMGINNTACYNPVVLSEMRCYALFSVLDPLMFVGAAGKVAGLAGRGLEKAIAKEGLSSEVKALEKATELKTKARKFAALKAHTNPEVDRKIAVVHARHDDVMQEAIKNPDSILQFWQDNGVKLNKDGTISLNSAEVAQNIETRVDDLVSSGKIKESDSLKPVLLYKLDGKTISVSPTELPPVGAVRVGSLLKSDEFFQMVADGKFPLGDSRGTQARGSYFAESTFLHDTGHMIGFIQNPEFMASARQTAKKVLAIKDPELRAISENRILFASEYSQTFSKEHLAAAKNELRELRAKIGLQKNTNYSVEGYEASLKKLDRKTLEAVYNDLNNSKLATARTDAVGGAEHIIPHRFYTDENGFDNGWPIDNEKYVNRRALIGQKPLSEVSTTELAAQVASAMGQSDAFISIRPQDWMREAVRGKDLPPMGNTLRACKTVQTEDRSISNFYKLFCVGK
jgi:hypothetical protein